MKIDIQALTHNTPFSIKIHGNEEWLGEIYRQFNTHGSSAEMNPSKIRGDFRILKSDDSMLKVEGSLTFTPQVSCSRCDENIPWEIQESIDLFWILDENHLWLANEDYNDEFLIENRWVQLEPIINETLVLAIPARTVKQTESGACGICGDDLSSSKVYTTQKKTDEHPMQVLANWRSKKS